MYAETRPFSQWRKTNSRCGRSLWRTKTKKGTIMKQLLALICGATLIVAYAQAQTSKTTEPATSLNPAPEAANPSTSTMSRDKSTTQPTMGTVTEYTPGSSITIDSGTGNPEQFTISDKVQVLGPGGKAIAKTNVKKNSRVQLHTVQEGARTVVDQITVESMK